MSEASPWRRRCAMCREVFDGFRATWTDICAECEPKVRAMRLTSSSQPPARTPQPQEVEDGE